jgi:DnaK suppressor protein
MRKRELDKIKKELIRRRREILGQALDPKDNDLKSERENLLDSGDVATQEVNQSFKIRLREREEKLLKKIDSALERIDGGDFGRCDDCGQAIEVKRLMARPVTTLCITCKSRQEEEEAQEQK